MTKESYDLIRVLGYLTNKKSMSKAEEALGITNDEKLLEFITSYEKCCKSYSNKIFKRLRVNPYFINLFKFFHLNITKKGDLEESEKLLGLSYKQEAIHNNRYESF